MSSLCFWRLFWILVFSGQFLLFSLRSNRSFSSSAVSCLNRSRLSRLSRRGASETLRPDKPGPELERRSQVLSEPGLGSCVCEGRGGSGAAGGSDGFWFHRSLHWSVQTLGLDPLARRRPQRGGTDVLELGARPSCEPGLWEHRVGGVLVLRPLQLHVSLLLLQR